MLVYTEFKKKLHHKSHTVFNVLNYIIFVKFNSDLFIIEIYFLQISKKIYTHMYISFFVFFFLLLLLLLLL